MGGIMFGLPKKEKTQSEVKREEDHYVKLENIKYRECIYNRHKCSAISVPPTDKSYFTAIAWGCNG